MSKVVILSGSPSTESRLYGLINYTTEQLQQAGAEVTLLNVVDLPAEDLVTANFNSPDVTASLALIAAADAVIVASPVYKASYSGLLKIFLDLVPQEGLRGKPVLPLFIGGTLAHLLVIDYALKPVINALGGRHILGGVYAVDQWVERLPDGAYGLSEELVTRLERSVKELNELLKL
ncbi:NADPH-dependent FMN reductase [Paenibacillus polymyxa]|uniref:NADPH-dependent FMN reductase n=1 Tax=Paenibacillus polymyxa TaxID=1406 RepID=UPI002AB5715A|nr:NADPH-dependent FMN reductase [Paenibacillus polymyxa]MDY7990118.1 NADPH-dependent FMN reductase [Paenibacillus polymyxa]MDY8116518.1 NADPH-dependent FMN reductase [Paenibacillus polymyxa]